MLNRSTTTHTEFRFIQEDILQPGVLLAIQDFALVEIIDGYVNLLVGQVNVNIWPSEPFGYATSFVQLRHNTSQILLADHDHGCIRLIERESWSVSTYSGNCSKDEQEPVDGNIQSARFGAPYDLALANGRTNDVLLTDKLYIRKIDTLNKSVTTVYQQFVDPEQHFWVFQRLLVTNQGQVYATRYKAGLHVFSAEWRLERVSRPRFNADAVLDVLRGDYRIPAAVESFESIAMFTDDLFLISLPSRYGLGSMAILNLKDDSVTLVCPGIINSEVQANTTRDELIGACERSNIYDLLIVNHTLLTAGSPSTNRDNRFYNLSGVDAYKINGMYNFVVNAERYSD